MTCETKTAALVATTLGMATVAATMAVLSATALRAEDGGTKILDRIADTRPAVGNSAPAPAEPRVIFIGDADGAVVYRADPAKRETVIARDVPQFADGVPLPQPRRIAVLAVAVSMAMPLPRPQPDADRVGSTLPGPALMRLPLPRPPSPGDEVAVAEPLPRPHRDS